MDATDQRWSDSEETAVAELRRLFRELKNQKPYGEFGVRIITEGARGPQYVILTKEPKTKI